VKAWQIALGLAVVVVLAGVVVWAAQSRAAGTDTEQEPSTAPIGQQTKRLGCTIQGPLPETACTPGAYEVDHLVSLELGGSNGIANLWPEAAEPRPGFHEKDRYENYLHAEVCAGRMPLQEAQRRIADNCLAGWEAAGRP
jgi:hypothetical protein